MADDNRGIVRWIRVAYDKVAGKKMEQDLESSLQTAGEQGGKAAGRATMTELRREFDKKKATLARDLASGVISQKEWKSQTDAAARTFNDGVLKLMDEAKAKGADGEREFNKLGRALKRVGDQGHHSIGGRLVDALKRAAVAAAALFGIRQIIRFGRESIRAADALQAVQRGLEQQLQNVGVAWGNVSHEVQAHARALWDTHRLTAGEVMDTLRQLVVVTGDYALSLRAVGTVQDIVKATGLGVEQAARLLGRALNGEISVFNRYGVTLDATRDILEQLEERFNGAALAGTTAGESLSKAWTDFKEALGGALLSVAEGESVLDRVTRAVRHMTDNIDELLHTVKALTIAVGVMIGVRGIAGMAIAFRGATAAALTLRTALQGFWAMLGPKGWMVLGVVALTEAIRRKGLAARQTARDLKEWHDSLRAMSIQELESELVKVLAQRRQVQGELDRAVEAGNKRLEASARDRLEIIRQGGNAIIRELARLRSQVDQPTPGAGGEPGAAADPARKRHEEAGALKQLAVQQKEYIANLQREIEIQGRRAGAILEGEEAVAALNRELHIEQILLRSGAVAGTEFFDTVKDLAGAHWDVAEAARQAAASVQSDYADAFAALKEEADAFEGAVSGALRAISEGGVTGLARLAKAKVIENLAWAAENFAKAMGWVALGNVASAAAAKKAATGHVAAAAKWGAIGGGAMAGGGGSGGAAGGARVPSMTQARNANPPAAKTQIFFDPFTHENPRHARVFNGFLKDVASRDSSVEFYNRSTGKRVG